MQQKLGDRKLGEKLSQQYVMEKTISTKRTILPEELMEYNFIRL
jgi:hypothetical protein